MTAAGIRKTKKKSGTRASSSSSSSSSSYKRSSSSSSSSYNVPNGTRYTKNGWVYVSISGTPYERGVAHGTLLAAELKRMFEVYEFFMMETYGRDVSFFLGICDDFFRPQIQKNFPELYDEMRGIAHGSKLTIPHILFSNCYMSLPYLYPKLKKYILESKSREIKEKYANVLRDEDAKFTNANIEDLKDRCSLFMAVGKSWTKDGKIVCAHNSFSNFIDGQFCNIVLSITPEKGHSIIMQSFPGGVYSGTDFFITSGGFIGSETTISNFTAFDLKDPICCRIRTAMQYGNTLSDYETSLTTRNSGDYACSWLIGDIKRNRIMRIELGLNYHNVETTDDGYFIGFNSTFDDRIRNIECSPPNTGAVEGAPGNNDFDNINSSIGNRRVQLTKLMEKYKGALDTHTARIILGNHYDNYLGKSVANEHSVCKHTYADKNARRPFAPIGAYDGTVADSKMAGEMSFLGRWGPSCGGTFHKKIHCKKHPEWNRWEPYLEDFHRFPWTVFSMKNNWKNKTRKSQK